MPGSKLCFPVPYWASVQSCRWRPCGYPCGVTPEVVFRTRSAKLTVPFIRERFPSRGGPACSGSQRSQDACRKAEVVRFFHKNFNFPTCDTHISCFPQSKIDFSQSLSNTVPYCHRLHSSVVPFRGVVAVLVLPGNLLQEEEPL